jgi:asparagine synthase (glutamine-hydrolysing)
MTALAAYYSPSSQSDVMTTLSHMLTALKPFGPDQQDSRHYQDAALGRALYRMVPEDKYDHQPIGLKENKQWLIADLRLDNRSELASELGLTDENCRQMSDSALLARCLEAWDIAETLPKLIGPFAFIVWDAGKKTLHLCRDQIGHRPLFYSVLNGTIACASMPAGLLCVPDVSRRLNNTSIISRFLQLPNAGTETHFKDIHRVPPGTIVSLRPERTEIAYWGTPLERISRNTLSFEDNLSALDHLVRQAIGRQTRSLQGVGGHLSSGLDSGLIAAIAAQRLSASQQRYHAYTARPRDTSLFNAQFREATDESPMAQRLAQQFPNVTHSDVAHDENEFTRVVDRYGWHAGEPLFSPFHTMWFDSIAQKARRSNVTVLLTGEGGNATVTAGYGVVNGALLSDYGVVGRQLRTIGLAARKEISWLRWAADMLDLLPNDMQSMVLKKLGRSRTMIDPKALKPRHLEDANLAQELARWHFQLRHKDSELGDARLLFLKHVDWGPHYKALLAETGVDVRPPLLSADIVRYCLSIPTNQFFQAEDRSFGKALFKHHAGKSALRRHSGLQQAVQNADSALVLKRAIDDLCGHYEMVGTTSPILQRVDTDCLRKRVNSLAEALPSLKTTTYSTHHYSTRQLARTYAMSVFIERFDATNRSPEDIDSAMD